MKLMNRIKNLLSMMKSQCVALQFLHYNLLVLMKLYHFSVDYKVFLNYCETNTNLIINFKLNYIKRNIKDTQK